MLPGLKPTLLSLAVVLMMTGCGIVPHYATAKLAGQGEWQITPAATIHSFNSKPRTTNEDEEALEGSGSGLSVGAAAAYGITDEFNAAVRYEHFPGEAKSRHFLHGELKVGVERGAAAFSFGYGQLLGADLHQLTMNMFMDYPLQNGVVFCLSPQGSMLFGSDGPVGFFDATLNGSLAYPVTPALTVFPQVGVSVLPLLFNTFVLKAGFAGRYEF